ncbi:MAG: alpha/beta hydrolase [Desulfobacterales bacterium]
MHRLKTFIIALVAIGVACATPAMGSNESVEETLKLTSCQLSMPGSPTRLAADCGTLTVYENRKAASGRKIDLHIAVRKAYRRVPDPDPLFLLAGGPGQAATEAYVQMRWIFEKINRARDIVLVDQRGTGKSHPLKCAEPDGESTLAEENNPEKIRELVTTCLKNLDADPAFYTTPIAMADLDDIRHALGYEKINIYGISYGTRAALTYLRQFPDRVRAMILDGVVPQDEALGRDIARDAQRALDLIMDRCKADKDCHAAFPDIAGGVDTLIRKLKESPAELTIDHPMSGKATPFTLDWKTFASTLRLFSYSDTTVVILPLLIHNALEADDLGRLGAQSLFLHQQMKDALAIGMHNSIICTEDVPFLDLQEARKRNEETYLSDFQVEGLMEICKLWPKGELPPDFKEPVSSAIPVLLLSGEADPVTPPENAEQVAETLSNSLHIVVAGQGHGVIGKGCLPEIARSFIATASISTLETSCIEKIGATPFFIDFAGPPP